MTISLYDASVANYLQVLGGVSGFLEKARTHFATANVALDDIVAMRLAPDMKPFGFQIRSVVHQSVGAIEGLRKGSFAPPGPMPPDTYVDLQRLVSDTRATLEATTEEEIDTLSSREVVFQFGEYRLPFTAANFILSFSLPNFYFHAATAYDMLRIRGMPLEKRDYLGRLRFERRPS